MASLEKALPQYLAILDKKERPRFKRKEALLKRRVASAFKILENCELCERKCHIDRTKAKLGVCHVGDEMLVSSTLVHLGEEQFLVPSFTVFFWSCTFQCQFCQNWRLSQRFEQPMRMTERELAGIIDRHAYCRNVNFVGGDPTPQLPFILKTLSLMECELPVVWNSNFYLSEKAMRLLKGLVDVYLPDFKYGNDECAERLSKVKDYMRITTRNHLLAFKDAELVIRHLVMPNHVECCSKPILEWVAEHLGDRVIVNIMDQYRPAWKASQYEDINRSITREEFNDVVSHAEDLGLNYIT